MAFLLLFLFWLLLNGRVTLEIALVGAVLSGFFALVARSLLRDRMPQLGRRLFRCLPWALLYLPYLTGQILLADLQVMAVILSPGKERPKLVWFTPGLQRDAARLALANSITLTPGTVTAGLGGRTLCVYALRPKFAQGLADSGFVRRLCRLEERGHG